MKHEIDEFMFVHLFGVKIRYEETDVVTFDCFSTENDEIFRPHHHKAHKFFAQNPLDVVRLFDGNTDTNRIDRTFDENFFPFVATDEYRRQKELFARSHFDFGFVMPFDDLRREIVKAHGGVKGVPHGGQIGAQSRRHFTFNLIDVIL